MVFKMTQDERVTEAMKEVCASMLKYEVGFVMPQEDQDSLVFLAPIEELALVHSERVH